ncbi:MAG: MFS transporter [Verrucomicrobia bacterium]|nr:MAG: MFS transporter [Verrucomicrobiota bacterium]
MNSSAPGHRQLSLTEWLILFVAILGFAFDTYELLMLPLIARPALAELLRVDPATASGNAAILKWTGYMLWGSAVSGGVFGLIGGWLTDRFGRKRVLVWSIFLYALSPLAAAFCQSAEALLILRCATFIGVCVEFVAAVAWLAELFPDPRQREKVLGFTQAFSSFGGLMVAGAYYLAVTYGQHWPAIHGGHAPWRYTLISGLVPAIPLMFLLPLLPESPAWKERRAAGTLKRPSIAQLFQPAFRRTTIATAILFACAYGAAFGAIQMTPQIVPGLVPGLPELAKLRKQVEAAQQKGEDAKEMKKRIAELSKEQGQIISNVQTHQEIGGLVGRFAFAWLAIVVAGRKALLRVFQIPGLILIPLVFLFPATNNLELFKWGIAIAGFFTIAQFSFWGNYLPRVYPVYLRGTGESFAANVGGRMIGTSGAFLTTNLALIMPGASNSTKLAYAAAAVAFLVYAIGFITSFWLPEPKPEEPAE